MGKKIAGTTLSTQVIEVVVAKKRSDGLNQRGIVQWFKNEHDIMISQPEVSRLVRAYRASRFRPSSPLGRVLARHRDEVLALARAHKARNVRVFGSVVRGEDAVGSDIDLLVDLEPGADLLDLASLDIELEDLLGHPVDIVPARLLKPHVAQSALADAVEL